MPSALINQLRKDDKTSGEKYEDHPPRPVATFCLHTMQKHHKIALNSDPKPKKQKGGRGKKRPAPASFNYEEIMDVEEEFSVHNDGECSSGEKSDEEEDVDVVG